MRQLIKLTVAGSLIWGALSPALAPAVAADANVPADISVPARKPADPSKPFGMSRRARWTTSRIVGSPDPPSSYRMVRAFEKLTFINPVEMAAVPGTDKLLIAELAGRIVTFPNRPDALRLEPAADLKLRIPKLSAVYGFAFHPRFSENRYCYIAYVIGSGVADGSRVSRFTVKSLDPFVIDLDTEQVLITWLSGGHNGASIQFGPEGYLYISTGDGAGPFPPDGLDAGQDVTNLLSAVLRIDVDHPQKDKPYRIPEDNPFVALPGARGEIWAYGFRNPWKMSFDRARGDLWVGDVGWELWEMVYRVEKGGNYGWSVNEGPQTVRQEAKRGPTPILPPTVALSHVDARSVTGGYVYHGSRIPGLQGEYVYGDYVTGKIWGLRHDGTRVIKNEQLVDTAIPIVCFGVDHAGELYIVGYGEQGMLYRLEPNPAQEANRNFPTLLSRTGLFTSTTQQIPAAGVIGYSINAQPWADHATVERFVGIPVAPGNAGQEAALPAIDNSQPVWIYPNNTVLVKTLSLELERGNPQSQRKVETQILHFDQDEWRAYSYRWHDDQTDASLVDAAGADQTLTIIDAEAPAGRRRHTWRFASRTECLLCHNAYNNGSVLGFIPPQLDRAHAYPEGVDNQLRTLSHVGLFKQPIADGGPRLANPYDRHADVDARFRSYLHVNCAHCHRDGGGGTAHIHVQYDVPLDKTFLLGMRPIQGTFALHRGQVVAAGDPYRSVLFYRIAKLGPGRMPYFGSSVVDRGGLALVRDWIAQAKPLPVAAPSTAAAGGPDQPTGANSPEDAVIPAQRARQQQLIEKLHAAKDNDAASIRAPLDELLSNTSGALMLVAALDEIPFAPKVRDTVIVAAALHADPRVRDLFERFIPDEQRIQRLGTGIRADELLARTGDAARGRKVFFDTAGIACKNCHRVGSEGKAVGPDLTEIAKKYSRAQILESILEPSKTIEPKYQMWLIETSQGFVHSGILVERTAEGITLRNAEGNEVRVATKDVEQFAAQPKSLMPELQLRDMTADQVADLLAFLASLK